MPKLTMKKEDVQIAMARTFKSRVKTLNFSRKYDILKVSEAGDCTFTLQEEYVGAGEYRYIAIVKLDVIVNDFTKSSMYCLDGQVSVTSDENNSPVVTFLGVISIHER